MEILFENKYTRDEEMVKDIYRYFYFRRPFAIFLNVLFVLYFILGVLYFILDISGLIVTTSTYWFLIAIPPIWYVLLLFRYNINVKTAIQRDLEIHGKPIEVTVSVTDEVIRYKQSTGSELQLNYIAIKKVIQTKKYIYLRSKTNLLYPFKKDSFSIGNEKEFITFLNNKGMKLK
ncbi:MAG: YcxB family protein [Acutalibacteraceae bacterium]